MRSATLKAILSSCAFCAVTAFGQNPVDPPAVAPSPAAAEKEARDKREKQIRMYDPLDKSSPLGGDQTVPGAIGPAPVDGQPAPKPRILAPAARPLPGSVASSSQSAPLNPRSTGPAVVTEGGDDATASQAYNGPAVLSRSYTVSRPMVPQTIRWTPSLGYSETYDSGLTGAAVQTGGVLNNNTSFGYSANWGLSGRHFWKHDQLGVDYRGSATRYGGYSSYSGTNQAMNLDYSHAVSRRLLFNVVSSGSIMSQSLGLDTFTTGTATSVANLNISASPTVQLLDQGTRQWTNTVGMTLQQSARLSFNASGGMFFVQRTGAGIFGNTGYQAQGDVNYRYTRKMTIGTYYSFTDYTYSQRISVANFHTIGGIYSYALTRTAQIRLRAGASFLENKGQTSIQFPAEIAALLGQTGGVVESYHKNVTSDISAQVVKDFGRQRSLSFSYARGISPGNGLLLTSTQEAYNAGFSMTLFRRYSTTVSAGRNTLSSAAQTAGKYDTQNYLVSISRTYRHGLTGNVQFAYRKFDITGQPLLHHQYHISTGITWSRDTGEAR